MVLRSKKCAACDFLRRRVSLTATDEASRRRGWVAVATIRAFALIVALGTLSACAHGAAPPVGTVGISLDDARVAAAVRSALLADADLGLRAITVDVDRGVVSLSGVVRTEEEIQRAATVAGRAAGVREVKSGLKVGS